MVTKDLMRNLNWDGNVWVDKHNNKYRSIRHAKTTIKRLIGTVVINYVIKIPTPIRNIQLDFVAEQ